MKNCGEAFCLGMLVGAIVAVVFLMVLVESGELREAYDERQALIKECQLPLPRTEHCTIIAVPAKENIE